MSIHIKDFKLKGSEITVTVNPRPGITRKLLLMLDLLNRGGMGVDFKSLLKTLYNKGIYTVETNNEIIGFIIHKFDDIFTNINSMYICPDYRNIGIGTFLYEYTLYKVKRRYRADKLYVNHSNDIPYEFWEKKGFQRVYSGGSMNYEMVLPIKRLKRRCTSK